MKTYEKPVQIDDTELVKNITEEFRLHGGWLNKELIILFASGSVNKSKLKVDKPKTIE